ncbi:hypothetical protein OHB26_34720 [Nocardia sp. NBC_01503]|uniref:hypothetical protein n=1 Tax=Nocardia sp. NBC_01503 TaxID=2975997 RepID=UPI002E7BB80D|nr:hypothetical protein [Nocardia sp. NBC_01503]WTL31997.1 hypothetical protein OHB26_34720 [Nocardia sp. NBC_01503]
MNPLAPVFTQMTGSPVFTSHVGCIASLRGHQVCAIGVADADAVPADPMNAAAMTPPITVVPLIAFTVFSPRRLTRPLWGEGANKTLWFAYQGLGRPAVPVPKVVPPNPIRMSAVHDMAQIAVSNAVTATASMSVVVDS